MPTVDPALPRRAYSIDETIKVSGFPRNRIYALISEGKLKTFCHGRRRYVSARALDACIALLEAETEHGETA
ncbi:MAG: helix-turn-helix domain-containing protein [Burkholderiales bacterium]|nr:helix-turn-helix domain-containing protein [Burkholderiales bacterium]